MGEIFMFRKLHIAPEDNILYFYHYVYSHHKKKTMILASGYNPMLRWDIWRDDQTPAWRQCHSSVPFVTSQRVDHHNRFFKQTSFTKWSKQN